MKHLFFLLALALAGASFCEAQSVISTSDPAADSLVSFNISLGDAAAFADAIEDPAIIRAIAKKFEGVTDTAVTRNVRIKQRDLVKLAEVANGQRGAAWAARTARMRARVTQLCATRPWLAARITSIQQANARDDWQRMNSGLNIINRNREYDAAQ